MSDPTVPTALTPDPPRPAPPTQTWRDQLAAMVALWNLTPARLMAGGAALGFAVVVAWRVLAPPAPPPEMQIPFARPAVETTELSTDPVATIGPPGAAEEEVVVDVAGAVVTPGVHHLDTGARVVDAIDAAGGLAPDADPARINLAAVLVDGQQVYVARVGEAPPVAASAAAADGPTPLVDLNTASATELDGLPGIGPTTAEAIIDHRERNGPFASVDDLLDVRGIGDAKLEQLRDRVTV
ncbi:MAG TPA: ComEA family DNA-binding protein [Acidimicrobiales bacterium]